MATSHLLNKKVVLPVIVLAVALALFWVFTAGGGVSNAAEETDSTGALINTIVVSGMGQATAMPDKATINVSVQNDGATSAEALDANSKDTQKVLDRLKSEGIASKDIETANVAVYPNYTYDDKTGQQTLAGYRAENSITVTFTDLKLIGEIYAAVVEAGADTVYGPSWELDRQQLGRRHGTLERARERQEQGRGHSRQSGCEARRRADHQRKLLLASLPDLRQV